MSGGLDVAFDSIFKLQICSHLGHGQILGSPYLVRVTGYCGLYMLSRRFVEAPRKVEHFNEVSVHRSESQP